MNPLLSLYELHLILSNIIINTLKGISPIVAYQSTIGLYLFNIATMRIFFQWLSLLCFPTFSQPLLFSICYLCCLYIVHVRVSTRKILYNNGSATFFGPQTNIFSA